MHVLATSARKTSVRQLLRILVACVLLFYALKTFDVGEALARLRGADLALLSCALVVYYANSALCAARWRLLLSALGKPLSFPRLVGRYVEAGFFNLFAPSFVAGDLSRVYATSRTGKPEARDLGAVLLDRLLGLYANLVVVTVAFATGGHQELPGLWMPLLIGASLGTLAGPVVWGLVSRADSLPNPARYRLITQLARARDALHLTPLRSALLFLVSFAFILGMVVIALLLTRALGIPIPVHVLAAFVPLTALVLSLPVSIGGIGLRETLFVALYGRVGIAAGDALAFGLAMSSLTLIANLGGGVLFLSRTLLDRTARQPAGRPESR